MVSMARAVRNWCMCMWMLILVSLVKRTHGIRFELDKKECWVHQVADDGELLHVSFVVIKVDNPWAFRHLGVDVVIEAPGGHPVHSVKESTQGKFNLTAVNKGPYKLCFYNRGSFQETVDFDVHIGHLPREEAIKNEHIYPLMAQIGRLEEALYDVQFEQHWLRSQTDRQIFITDEMSKRVMYKAVLESLSLIACSVLQIVLLQRLFERKLAISRV